MSTLLIKDGRRNKILSKKIKSQIYVTMIHGKKDELVPVSFSRKILSMFKNGIKKAQTKTFLKKLVKGAPLFKKLLLPLYEFSCNCPPVILITI